MNCFGHRCFPVYPQPTQKYEDTSYFYRIKVELKKNLNENPQLYTFLKQGKDIILCEI